MVLEVVSHGRESPRVAQPLQIAQVSSAAWTTKRMVQRKVQRPIQCPSHVCYTTHPSTEHFSSLQKWFCAVVKVELRLTSNLIEACEFSSSSRSIAANRASFMSSSGNDKHGMRVGQTLPCLRSVVLEVRCMNEQHG